jgi:hypothetical protein
MDHQRDDQRMDTMQADIARAILAVETGQPIEGTSMEEWEAAIEKARKAREKESKLKKQSVSDAWDQTDIYRVCFNAMRKENISMKMWQRTYEGVFFAVSVIRGVEMTMTPQELKDAPVPKNNNGTEQWGQRKIRVARSKATPQVNDILSGKSMMMSATEMADVYAAMSKIQKELQPKGFATSNTKELEAINTLNKLLKLTDFLEFEHGIEGRENDGFSRVIDNNSNTTKTYVADQVKSSVVMKDGRGNCHSTVGKLLPILLDNRSVTCIVMDKTWKTVLVVWFLHGKDACEFLEKFDKSQEIRPVVSPKITSEHAFYKEFQSKKYRYNISEPAECERLLEAKIEFAKNVNSRRETYEFWNEDESQMCASHFKEQKIINAMNEKLSVYEISAKKHVEDTLRPVNCDTL